MPDTSIIPHRLPYPYPDANKQQGLKNDMFPSLFLLKRAGKRAWEIRIYFTLILQVLLESFKGKKETR